MQTPFSQHPYSSELFTRERRRTRMRQFFEAIERPVLTSLSHGPDMFPVKTAESQSKSHDWARQGSR